MKNTVEIQGMEYEMVSICGGGGFTLKEIVFEWVNYWHDQKQSDASSRAIEKAICDHIKKEIPDLQSLPFNERQARVNKVLYGEECDHIYHAVPANGYGAHENAPQKAVCFKCGQEPSSPNKTTYEENTKLGTEMQEACERIRNRDTTKCEFDTNKLEHAKNTMTRPEFMSRTIKYDANQKGIPSSKSFRPILDDLEILKDDTKQRILNLARKHGMTEAEARILYTMVP